MQKEKFNQMHCPLCNEVIYSEIGQGCKMCGMPLLNINEEFCSRGCKINYKKINIQNDS